MTNRNNKKDLFQRILVAVDAASHTEAGLDTAIYLASHLGAQVKGLFVRSPELHHICRLTFLSEVSEITGEIRPLPEQFMERQLSQAEKRIQHRVHFVEVRNRISCTWTSVVGSLADQVLEAAGEADLIVLEQTGTSISRSKKLAASIRKILDESGKSALIVPRRAARANIIIAVYDGTGHNRSGLETALSLAEATGFPLSLLIRTNDSDNPEAILNSVREQTADVDIPVDLSLIKNFRLWNFIPTVNRFPTGFLVISKNQYFAEDQHLDNLLDSVKHPLLLVR